MVFLGEDFPGRLCARLGNDDQQRTFGLLLVRNADHRGLQDVGMTECNVLQFDRTDPLAARFNESDGHDADGWFATGDVVTIDADGYINIGAGRSQGQARSNGDGWDMTT